MLQERSKVTSVTMTGKITDKNKNVGKNVAKLPNGIATLENKPHSLKSELVSFNQVHNSAVRFQVYPQEK